MGTVLTVPAELPFLDAIAAELVRRKAEGLVGTRLLLPSRRACLAMRDAFLRQSGGRAMLLPRMQPIGESGEDELALDPAQELSLPPPLSPIRRQLLLTRLVLAQDRTMAHEQAVRLAVELAAFLDEVQTERVDLDRLDDLVSEDHARHWQMVLRFLRLVRDAWPKVLAAEGAIDPAQRRNLLLAAVGRSWSERPPSGPVIAAGITGSIPAVADLLAVVRRLPDGCVVLPGLDRGLDEASWRCLGASHPQWVMRRLLERLGVDRAAVGDWPVESLRGGPPARVRLLAEIMRPAGTSRAWQTAPPPAAAALRDVELVEARGLAQEALELALRIREALEVQGRRVALITSDRNLARRVAAELQRWGIRADDSAGIPLDQSPPAGLMLLAAHALAEALAPSPLLAMLKHPLASGGIGAAGFRRYVRALERAALRGPRPGPGFAGLRDALQERVAADRWTAPVAIDELTGWLAGIEAAAAPITALLARPEAPFGELIEAHLGFVEWLATDAAGSPAELWAMEAGACLAAFLAELRDAAPAMDGVPSDAFPALLAILMGQQAVRPQRPAHPRVAILGQLESRLIQADLVLIGGLNEGVWPRQPDAGPWLNRRMRAGLGLPPVEQQIGIAAFDLAMAAAAPEVVLSRARTDETGAPVTPSRWLARLRAVLDATGIASQVAPRAGFADWGRAIDAPGSITPCAMPEPRPAARRRPKRLSVTDIEQLVRNPYGLFAKRVLRLRALDPIDADPGVAERGQIIHAILDEFVRATAGGLPADAAILLREIGTRHFARTLGRPQVAVIWWPRFLRIAEWFLALEQERRGEVRRVLTELEGKVVVPGGFEITARADRVEIGRDGRVAVLDYKTGNAPQPGNVRDGLSPQMPIEALIAMDGGFDGVPAAVPGELLYLVLKGGDPAGEAKLAGGRGADPVVLAQAARDGLARLSAWLSDPQQPLTPVPRPEIAPAYDDYEHLARTAEWRRSGILP